MRKKLKGIFFADKTFPFVIRYNNDSKPYPTIHSHYKLIEMHYVVKGGATYLLDNRLVDIKANDFYITNRNVMHRMTRLNCNYGDLHMIGIYFHTDIFNGYGGFKEKITGKFFSNNKNIPSLISLEGSVLGEADFLLRSILKDYKSKDEFRKENVIFGFAKLCALILKYAETYKEKRAHDKEPDIQGALNYIDRNFKEELDLINIARKIGLTPNYLSSKFKKATGVHLKDYIIAKRINEAKKILEESPANKIISVVYDVGFKDVSHFNHTFKKLTGMAPSSFRRLSEGFRKACRKKKRIYEKKI